MRKVIGLLTLAVGLAGFSAPAQAFQITGELDLAGALRITKTGILDWVDPVAPSVVGCPTATSCGIADISKTTNTDYFAVFNAASAVPNWRIAELDLVAALFPATPGSFPELADFETTPNSIQGVDIGGGVIVPRVSPLPQLTFSLASIIGCQQGCGFGFAPQFNVSFTGGNTTVIMNVLGTVCDPGNPLAECNGYRGQFTAQFVGRNPASLIAELDNVGYIQTSFSASKITAAAVPEPATLVLFGMGSVAATVFARRRNKK